MIHKIDKFSLELPVNLGLEQLKQKANPICALSSQDIGIMLKIQKELLLSDSISKKFIESRNIEITSNKLTLSQFEQVEQNQLNQSCIRVSYAKDNYDQFQNNLFSFSISMAVNNKGRLFQVNLCHQIIELRFRNVSKVKFVKNDRLEKIIKINKEEWGLLSMDSSARVLLESRKTTYPIIGIWQKKQEEVDHISTFYKVVQYLRKEYANKCKFTYQKANHFYYVKLGLSSTLPELFIVEWNQKQQKQSMARYHFNQIQGDIFEFDSTNPHKNENLEFTLRSNEKKFEHPTIDFSQFSPIKFIQNQQIQEILCKNSQQFSPKFQQQNKVQALESQNYVLRQRVRIQELQIQILKSQLARINNSLKFASKSKFSIDQLNSSNKTSEYGSSAKLCKKKLTKSDLQINSAQIKSPDGTQSSLNGDSIENFRKTRQIIMKSKSQDIFEEDQQPWDRLQLVQTE